MQTNFLKFSSETAALVHLAAFRAQNETGGMGWVTASESHALDVVGTLHKATGAYLEDSEGTFYPEMRPLDGFHVNLAIDVLPEALLPYVIIPNHPMRVFA